MRNKILKCRFACDKWGRCRKQTFPSSLFKPLSSDFPNSNFSSFSFSFAFESSNLMNEIMLNEKWEKGLTYFSEPNIKCFLKKINKNILDLKRCEKCLQAAFKYVIVKPNPFSNDDFQVQDLHNSEKINIKRNAFTFIVSLMKNTFQCSRRLQSYS